MRFRAVLALTAAIGSVGGCAGGTSLPASTPSAVVDVAPPVAVAVAVSAPMRDCPPLPADMLAEARRTTDVTGAMTGELMISELRKNRRLAEMAASYERCRRR